MSLEITVYADSVQGHWYTAICVHCHWFALGVALGFALGFVCAFLVCTFCDYFQVSKFVE